MNIGEKIRSLRLAKLMTQSELAGNHMTRNMLSCIESGAAQPSLSTLTYIAERLNVPAGFFLAEEGDEIVYQKMNSLANIKRAYKARDFFGCRSLCLSSCPEPDDEIRFLLAECDMEIAKDSFWQGKLRLACRFFDEALLYSNETLYRMPHIKAESEVYFRYMRKISATLYSDVMNDSERLSVLCRTPFSVYADALEALEQGNRAPADRYGEDFSEERGFFAVHLQVRLLMDRAEYQRSKEELLNLLQSDTPINEVNLYAILCDLEICCRETDDYKGAYRYTNEKVELLEQLLKNNV